MALLVLVEMEPDLVSVMVVVVGGPGSPLVLSLDVVGWHESISWQFSEVIGNEVRVGVVDYSG